MADGKPLIRRIVVVFDRESAKKSEQEFQDSLAKAGEASGKAFLRELRGAFDKRMAELKTQLAQGFIDEKEFKKQANIAAKAFNTGLISSMEKARKQGQLTDKEYVKLTRSLKKVGDEGETAGNRIRGSFLKAGAILAGAFSARAIGQSVFRFFRESITEAIAAEQSVQRLDSVLRPLGLTYQQVGREVEQFFDRLQKTTRFSDDDAREAFVNLLTATGDYRKSLDLLDVTAKIAEKRQTTMAEAAQTAADASKGLTRGMKDLGIITGETGDIVGKINSNLGNLAEDGLRTTSGQLKNANNLWNEFKEEIGRAILGSNDLQGALGDKGLRKALIDLNTWAKDHSKDITAFVDKIIEGGRALGKISAFILKFQPALALLRLINKEEAEAAAAVAEATSAGSTPGTRAPALTAKQIAAQKAAQKAAAEERKRIERENAQTLLDLRAQVQRTELGLLTEHQREYEELTRSFWARIQKLEGDALAEGIELLARAQENLLLKRSTILEGIDQRQPSLSQVQGRPASLDPGNLPEAPGADMGAFAARAQEFATAFENPWVEALDRIGGQVQDSMDLFDELSAAWSAAGIFGIVRLALAKIRENIAAAAEELAKAAASLASGNPAAAALHTKAAAAHKVAAVLWGVAGAAGAGAKAAGIGGGGGGSAGGIAAGAGPGSDRASRIDTRPEIHVHIPERIASLVDDKDFQKMVFVGQQNFREKVGSNVKVTIHRGSR